MTPIAKARQVFAEHAGMLLTSNAIRLGIHPRTLYAFNEPFRGREADAAGAAGDDGNLVFQ